MNNITEIKQFVKETFVNDVDKAGAPYYNHCLFVAELSKSLVKRYNDVFAGYSNPENDAYVVGLLHDIIEDHPELTSFVEQMVTKDQFNSVKLLTHTKDISYNDYLKRLDRDPIAMVVKAADAYHNSKIDRFNKEYLESLNDKDFKKIASRCLTYKKRSNMLLNKLFEMETICAEI